MLGEFVRLQKRLRAQANKRLYAHVNAVVPLETLTGRQNLLANRTPKVWVFNELTFNTDEGRL